MCTDRNAKLFAMDAMRLSAMGMERFALTTTRNMGVDGSALILALLGAAGVSVLFLFLAICNFARETASSEARADCFDTRVLE